jgi:hypothetical protein
MRTASSAQTGPMIVLRSSNQAERKRMVLDIDQGNGKPGCGLSTSVPGWAVKRLRRI